MIPWTSSLLQCARFSPKVRQAIEIVELRRISQPQPLLPKESLSPVILVFSLLGALFTSARLFFSIPL